MISLKQTVISSILRYPSLYKCKTFEDSEIAVLSRLLLGYGNGYSWNPDGFLYCDFLIGDPLPEDHFNKRVCLVDNNEIDFETDRFCVISEDGYLVYRDEPFKEEINTFPYTSTDVCCYSWFVKLMKHEISLAPDWIDGCIRIARYDLEQGKRPANTPYTRNFLRIFDK